MKSVTDGRRRTTTTTDDGRTTDAGSARHRMSSADYVSGAKKTRAVDDRNSFAEHWSAIDKTQDIERADQ